MTLVLVESRPDPASQGIAAELRSRPGWTRTASTFEGSPVWRRADVQLVTIPDLHIQAESLDARLSAGGVPATAVVFLSKHKSESARPTLTAHPVGNYVAADFGGRTGRLTPCVGGHLTHMLRCLDAARRESGYAAEVAFETTHHGPLLDLPCVFVELGSSEPQWNDAAGHEVLADAVTRFLDTPIPNYPVVVGLGGGHYAPRFTEAALTKEVHFAHLLPSHYAKAVGDADALAREIREKSPGAVGVYYHDGTLPKEQRDRWLDAFQRVGVPEVRSRDWRAFARVSTGPPTML